MPKIGRFVLLLADFFVSVALFSYFCCMKRNFFLIVFAAVLLVSCGQSEEEARRISKAERARLHREDSLALKIAVMPTLDCLPFYVAQDRGFFAEANADIRLRVFSAQMDCDTAFIGGSVELMLTDSVRAARLAGQGRAVEVVSPTDSQWMLVGNRQARVKKLAQLGEKMVAMTRFSATDMMTDKAFVKVSPKPFKIQVNDIRVRLDMLLNNELDAAWLPEPLATVAVKQGHTALADSRKLIGRGGLIVMRGELKDDAHRKQQLVAMEKAYNRACDSISHFGLEHYADIIASCMDIGPDMVKNIPKQQFRPIGKPMQEPLPAKVTVVASGKEK